MKLSLHCLASFGILFIFLPIHGKNDSEKENASEETVQKKRKESNDVVENKDKPKAIDVKRDHLSVKLNLEGVFESARMSEVSISTKAWNLFSVLEAKAQGIAVKKGETLIKIDFEKIDEEISKLRHELKILGLDYSIAEEDLKLAEAMAPLELDRIARIEKYAEEDLARYEKVQSPFNKRSAAMNLKNYEDSLAYAQEELKQLQKMYEADDLTEETEEIILTRAKSAVARAEFSLEGAKIRNENTLQISIPREDFAMKEETKRNELSSRTLRKTQPIELAKKRLEIKKLDQLRKKASEKLKRLESDRKAMSVPSPASGILYRGIFERGKWTGDSAVKAKLRKGGILKPNEVFMTIVESEPLFVRGTLNEANLRRLTKGLDCKVRSKAFPDLKLTGTITEVSKGPTMPGIFEFKVEVQFPKGSSRILPGMTCKLEFVVYENEKAVVVPSTAVFSEDHDNDEKFVYMLRDGREPKKQRVKVGERSGEKIEILEGLKAGKQILPEKPKD